jgi:hypothetical protein
MTVKITEGERGLYSKYLVKRTDGQDTHYKDKHFACAYYVLDITHDKHALPALAAYANSCEKEYPKLAEDLRRILRAVGYNYAG